ncbi:MAG: DUF541 domain-containing protein [Gammaproteobacteria bacterium]|nr:MAG: DUF541 domain-containing protein [Gammaproteobacteria bacterium]
MMRFSVLAVTVLLLAACSGPTTTTSATQATLSVNGHAEVRTAPDRARFSAAVVNEGEESEAVMAANAERTERMLTALRESGIATEQIRTQGVRLHPVWTPRPRNADENWRPQIIGYQARNQIEVVTADLAGVGTLLATAVRAGATDVDGVHFSLEDDASARADAIRIATERALAEATTLADAAGVRRGRILELRLDGASTQPPPMLRAASMDMRAEFASVPVEPGEVTVSAHVALSMAIN